MAINIIISFNNRTTNENNRKDNFSSALIFNFFCLLFAQFKRANRLRVNIKSSPLSKIIYLSSQTIIILSHNRAIVTIYLHPKF